LGRGRGVPIETRFRAGAKTKFVKSKSVGFEGVGKVHLTPIRELSVRPARESERI
jgi:hypothetical protein